MDRINQYVNQHKIGVEIINKSCAGEFWYIVWGHHDKAVIFNNRGGWLIHFAKKLKVIFGIFLAIWLNLNLMWMSSSYFWQLCWTQTSQLTVNGQSEQNKNNYSRNGFKWIFRIVKKVKNLLFISDLRIWT